MAPRWLELVDRGTLGLLWRPGTLGLELVDWGTLELLRPRGVGTWDGRELSLRRALAAAGRPRLK